MKHKRYARPRLITTDDRRYREHVAHFLVQRQNQRAMRPPRQRDIFGGQAEAALRDWLANQYTLSERRILEYEELTGRRANTKYRELDAVMLHDDPHTIRVFEIKASRAAHGVRRAVAQLRETRAILRLLYTTVDATILLVDTGIPTAEEAAACMTGPQPPRTPPATLDETVAALPIVVPGSSLEACSGDGETIGLLRFRVDDIIALVGAENLALDWSEDDEVDDTPPHPRETSPIYSTDDEAEAEAPEEAGGSLAAALRQAGFERDS